MSEFKIDIAEQFSDMPYGRYEIDGPDNGERFRKDFLVPALRENNTVNIFMDGAMGYGSSFLDESFGGLVRNEGFDKATLKKKLKLHCSLNYIIESVWQYIEEAKRE